jgi:4-hydroxy-tetrahydrodipicolinate synthase
VLLARDAKDAGADAILLCPPAAWLIGRAPGAVRMFFEEVGRAGIPIIVFQYAPWMGNAAYDLETLSEIAGMENVVGVKEASWEVLAYERAFRTLKARHPDFAVLSANDEHLMHTYLTGCDGTLVVYAALTPALICELYDACKQGDYARARRIHDRLWPITEAVFSVPPKSNWCVRVKEGLKMMGRLSSSRVRSPLVPASPDEISSLRAALESAGLL